MNRFSNRLFAASAGLAAGALILPGRGARQLSQPASHHAAVNGTNATAGDIVLRNVHLQAEQTSDFFEPGQVVPLVFLAANNSPDVDDKLVSISSEVGTVALAGDVAVPAGEALNVTLKGEAQAMGNAAGGATPATAAVTLTKPITNGLTYMFTFNFDKGGATTVAVPISAGEGPRD